jgi:hypothetical protein
MMVPCGAIFSGCTKLYIFGKMYSFVHLENVNTILIFLRRKRPFVYLAKVAMTANTNRLIVTYMIVMYFYLACHYQKMSSHPLFFLSTHATPTTTHLTTHNSQPPPPTSPHLDLRSRRATESDENLIDEQNMTDVFIHVSPHM